MLFLLDFARTCTQSVFICGSKITREIALVARSKTFNEPRQGFKEQQHIYDIYRYIQLYTVIYIYRYIQLYLPLNLCNTQAAVAAPSQSLLLAFLQETQPSVSRHLHAAASAGVAAGVAAALAVLPFCNLDSEMASGWCDWGALSHFYALAGLECGLPRATLTKVYRFVSVSVTYTPCWLSSLKRNLQTLIRCNFSEQQNGGGRELRGEGVSLPHSFT